MSEGEAPPEVAGAGAGAKTGATARLVAATLAQPVDPRVGAMAAAIAGQHPGALGVLFYGSCLRETRLDGLMLDFYLIVRDYRAAYGPRWLAAANRLLPPNVFPFAHGGLAAKYAVLDLADLKRLCGPSAGDVSVFARFAQPVRLVWQADGAEGAAEGAAGGAAIAAAVARAPATLASFAADGHDPADPLALWRTGFARTYACELRAEATSRGRDIVGTDAPYYTALTGALVADGVLEGGRAGGRAGGGPDERDVARRWARFRRRGKALSVARLAKASATFAGGIDYLAWKINRHAGTAITITPFQRRHPLLAALVLVPRLLKGGAIR